MSRKLMMSLAFATALVGSTIGAEAQNKPGQAFLMKAMEGNLAEVALGKLAQQKGASEGVKNLGRQLETDHSAANQKAMTVAASMGVTPPTKPDKKHQETYEKLSKLSGPAFDREFVQLAVSGHRKEIGEFEKEAKQPNNPVASYASETLPSLQKHLQMAQSLETAKTQ